jgi:hypothetical protein
MLREPPLEAGTIRTAIAPEAVFTCERTPPCETASPRQQRYHRKARAK